MSMKTMRMCTLIKCVSLAAVVAVTASCGDVVRSSRSPVMLVLTSITGGDDESSFLLSDVLGSRTSPAPCSEDSPCPTIFNDPGSASVAVVMKDASLAPTTNNTVTIRRYHIDYKRSDGRNTPGVDVPFPIDGAVTFSVDAGSTGEFGFELVRHTAKAEPPLVQLVQNPTHITTVATVTFFGTDQVGNDLSATGSIVIDFANFGDE